jgi:diguanylate cyclase
VRHWQRLALAGVAVMAAVGAVAIGATVSLDRMLTDLRFGLTQRPVSGQVLFVDIDSRSLSEIGVWPWPRQVYADILDALVAADVADVAFDIDFSSRSTEAGDAAFAAALAAAGGFARLAAFEQVDGVDGKLALNLPIEAFAKYADPVAVNVIAGPDGRVDQVASETQGIPALAVALSGRTADGPTIAIDFGIDITKVDRISAADIVSGAFDPDRVAGRQVVVGASAIELRDIFAVPRFGMVPGPLLQIAAVETLMANRSLTRLSWWPAGVLAGLVALGWAWFGSRLRVPIILAVAVAIATVSQVIAVGLQATTAITMTTSPLLLVLPILAGLDSAARLYEEFRRRRAAEQKLAWLALHDPTTGLASRRGFIDGPAGALDGAVVVLGLQRLDTVRGALGHAVADEALKQIAMRLDTLELGPLGVVDKDVLAIALPDRMDAAAAEVIAGRIRAALQPAIEVAGHTIHVDAQLAACCAPSADTTTRLRRAELALMLEAGGGTGAINRYAPELESDLDRRRRLDAALRRALDAGELTLAFQPQARLGSGEIIGAEALLRWHDPEFGIVSPAEFVPLAEETGLIVPIGRFVMMEACRIAATWQGAGRIAVNISSLQFRMTDVVELASDALIASGLDPARLEVEITESVMIEGDERLTATLNALHQLGVGIAIDDFGTGYSSLSYLTRLSFDKLKIDQSFVRRMLESPDDAAVVQSIVELAARLGKRTVAEGIETEAQLNKLVSMGCDVGQGWLIGRPVNADEIAARIADVSAVSQRFATRTSVAADSA